MSPCKALYGVEPALLPAYRPGHSSVDLLQRREEVQQKLKETLQNTQAKMKHYADLKRRDKKYEVGEWVWLKLQHYRQTEISGQAIKF